MPIVGRPTTLSLLDNWFHGHARGFPVRKRPTSRAIPLDGLPLHAIVWHWTAGFGSAATLARMYAEGAPGEVAFHLGIDRDGSLTQLAGINRGTQHCRGRFPANGRVVAASSIGIELVNVGRVMRDTRGRWRQVLNPEKPVAEHQANPEFVVPPADVVEAHGGFYQRFTDAQVETARAIVQALHDKGHVGLRHYGHLDLDPARKADPGPLWMADVLPTLLPIVSP